MNEFYAMEKLHEEILAQEKLFKKWYDLLSTDGINSKEIVREQIKEELDYIAKFRELARESYDFDD